MKKVLTVIGARPQFIKAAVLSRVFAQSNQFQEIIVNTGQHYDPNMSQIFFEELAIPHPNYELNIGSASHGAQTGAMLEQVEHVLIKENPDCVLVYGDTNSTLAGALSAAKLHIPVAHIESGLRSFNRKMPEEINRVMTDHLSDYLFVPTSLARENLLNEGIAAERIYPVGDVMCDAFRFYSERVGDAENEYGEYALVTIHRAENTDCQHRLSAVVQSLVELATKMHLVLPLHPRTAKYLKQYGLYERLRGSVTIVPPASYLDMIKLLKQAKLVITDSGGVQKEAYFAAVPCITLREETEWVELVDARVNYLLAPVKECEMTALAKRVMSQSLSFEQALYGDGYSAEKIAIKLEELL